MKTLRKKVQRIKQFKTFKLTAVFSHDTVFIVFRVTCLLMAMAATYEGAAQLYWRVVLCDGIGGEITSLHVMTSS